MTLKVVPTERAPVVVAFVVVLFTAVKFWRVVEPVKRRLLKVVKPEVTFKVPVKFAALEMF